MNENAVNTTQSGGDPSQAVNPSGGENAVSTSATAPTEKTFTQEEVNSIVKERLDRAKKDMPSKEEMNAFKAWKDSQKTAEELSAERISAAETAMAEAVKRAENAEAKAAALSKGVSPDAVDDVIALAACRVSDAVTLDAAIGEVIAKYPALTNGAKAPITTGAKIGGGNTSGLSDVEAAFYAKNPDLLPSKR